MSKFIKNNEDLTAACANLLLNKPYRIKDNVLYIDGLLIQETSDSDGMFVVDGDIRYDVSGNITQVTAGLYMGEYENSVVIELTLNSGLTVWLIFEVYLAENGRASVVSEICNTTIKLSKSGVKFTKTSKK